MELALESVEMDIPQFECEHGNCRKQFKNASRFNAHLKSHVAGRPFTCMYCDKTFTDSGGLKSHVRIHTLEKPYTCEQCGRQFVQAGNLRSHERTHLKLKRFVCMYCDRAFSRATHLRNHMIRHTGGLPHQCPECGEVFVQARLLKLHRALAHGVGQLYACDRCGKTFTAPSILSVHMQTHDKLFVCSACPKRLRSTQALERHLAKIHKLHKSVGDPVTSTSACKKLEAVSNHMDGYSAGDGKLGVCGLQSSEAVTVNATNVNDAGEDSNAENVSIGFQNDDGDDCIESRECSIEKFVETSDGIGELCEVVCESPGDTCKIWYDEIKNQQQIQAMESELQDFCEAEVQSPCPGTSNAGIETATQPALYCSLVDTNRSIGKGIGRSRVNQATYSEADYISSKH